MLRAQEENGLFRQLEAEWGRQCDAFGEDIDEYATPSMAHAREIVAGKHDTDKYGIYVLVNDTHHECLAHCNVARLPGTTGKTMRMVWVLLAPKYDFDETEPKVLASIAAALVTETIRLSAGNEEPQMRADHIKITWAASVTGSSSQVWRMLCRVRGTFRMLPSEGTGSICRIANAVTFC